MQAPCNHKHLKSLGGSGKAEKSSGRLSYQYIVIIIVYKRFLLLQLTAFPRFPWAFFIVVRFLFSQHVSTSSVSGTFLHSILSIEANILLPSDLVMCRKQSGIAIGRLCDKCDGKCPVCDSYVRPTTLVRICDECSFGNYQNKCVVCGGEGISDAFYCFECTRLEKDRDGCPKIINLGSSRTDVGCYILLRERMGLLLLLGMLETLTCHIAVLPEKDESDGVLAFMWPGFGPWRFRVLDIRGNSMSLLGIYSREKGSHTLISAFLAGRSEIMALILRVD